MSNTRKLAGTLLSVNRDYPTEIIEARRALYPMYKDWRDQNRYNKVSIQYPAKLIVNGQIKHDMFPDWSEVMAGYRVDSRQLYINNDVTRNQPKGFGALSPIGRIKILTYLIWGILGAAILDCHIGSCDLFYWFIRTCLGPTVIPAAITSLELSCVMTMCYFSDNVSSKEIIKIVWLIFLFYYSDIIAIKKLVFVL